MFGAISGFTFGQLWFFVSPVNGFAAQKLFASVGERPWSGRMYRMVMAVGPAHALYGGAAFLGYDLITEFLRHHDETNLRPKFLDHLFAMSILGAGAGFMAFNSIRGAF